MTNPFLEPDSDEWEASFDKSPSAGWACLICHALVPAMPRHGQAHIKWHEDADGS